MLKEWQNLQSGLLLAQFITAHSQQIFVSKYELPHTPTEHITNTSFVTLTVAHNFSQAQEKKLCILESSFGDVTSYPRVLSLGKGLTKATQLLLHSLSLLHVDHDHYLVVCSFSGKQYMRFGIYSMPASLNSNLKSIQMISQPVATSKNKNILSIR